MNYALLDHQHSMAGLINFGDHIQSLAAEQYLPQVDLYIERDRLNSRLNAPCKLIMNGWFTYAPQNWPPDHNIEPLFISFHLNPRYAEELLGKKENVTYLKSHAPIGCRDYRTLEIMQKYGIDSYYSFCLTTTLDLKYKSSIRTEKIYFVDVLYNFDQSMVYKSDPKRILFHLANGRIFKTMNLSKKKKILKSLFPNDVIDSAVMSHQYCKSSLSTQQKFQVAKDALNNYSSAKLVVTSRIHCALPCLALNTPVLFVIDGLENESVHLSRLSGTVDHMNILSTRPAKEINKLFGKRMNVFHPNEIDWDNPPANPDTYLKYTDSLKSKCQDFVSTQ